MVWSAGCSLLMTEGFSSTLDVLYGGINCNLDQKNIFKNFNCKFISIFGSSKVKTLDPDPKMPLVPQPLCMLVTLLFIWYLHEGIDR